MAGIVGLITAISNDVVAKIAAAGLPPLVDGAIVIGRAKEGETSFPPRIVFTPLSFRWAPPSPGTNSQPINPQNPAAPGSGVRSYAMTAYGQGYAPGASVTISAPDLAGGTQAAATAVVTSNGAISKLVPSVVGSGYLYPPTVTISGTGLGAGATANLGPTPQAITVIQQRSILSEWHKFDVLVWGASSSGGVVAPDVNADYDATQQLYQQVIASMHALAAGVHDQADGRWVDAASDAMAIDTVGHAVRFTVELMTPLLSEPMPPTSGGSVQIAPPQTQQNPTTTLLPSSL